MGQKNIANEKIVLGKEVDASPTKSFFVEMLTRDIELKDAVLDLLDNCLDGAIRTLSRREPSNQPNERPYRGFEAEIEFGSNFFRITDNCGGMDREVLMDHAFRLGRPRGNRDKDLATVGLYGIGMKRAIFKMGRSCTVITRHDESAYQVSIPSEWLTDDDEWRLALTPVDHEKYEKGTIIEIKNLYPEVIAEFDLEKNKEFAEAFETAVATQFSYIIQKGFSVKINGKPIKNKEIYFRVDETVAGKERLAPYMYHGLIDEVTIDLVVGLHRDVPSESELERMDEGGRFRKEDAGWTVICNDRVVLFNDTTHVTGWGEGNVPKYHTQFTAISGVVRFSTDNPKKLPVTTTKRGINLNSALYAEIKNIMREGVKHFTDFTNKWKTDPSERKKVYKQTVPINPWKALSEVSERDWSVSKKYGGKIYIPKLPTPQLKSETDKAIRFTRSGYDIQILSIYFFDDANMSASEVGARCFDDYLEIARAEI